MFSFIDKLIAIQENRIPILDIKVWIFIKNCAHDTINIINNTLEKLTGINQKQIHHYASGLRKPREQQRRKIAEALHQLGEELLSIDLE